jgi:hypothetical protein
MLQGSPGGEVEHGCGLGCCWNVTGKVAASWQGKELLRAIAGGRRPAAPARLYRWADGVQVTELSR